jgi:hypothetical protein
MNSLANVGSRVLGIVSVYPSLRQILSFSALMYKMAKGSLLEKVSISIKAEQAIVILTLLGFFALANIS